MYGAICLLAPLQSHCGFVGFLIATRLWLVDVKMIYRPWDCELSQVHCNCLRCYELILEQFLCYQSCMLSWIAWFGDQVSSGKKINLRQSSQALQYGNIGVSCTHVYICTSDENCKMQQTYGGVALMDWWWQRCLLFPFDLKSEHIQRRKICANPSPWHQKFWCC